MPGLKKKFTIFHIEFAEKSQKIRTVAVWYKKLCKKKPFRPPCILLFVAVTPTFLVVYMLC